MPDPVVTPSWLGFDQLNWVMVTWPLTPFKGGGQSRASLHMKCGIILHSNVRGNRVDNFKKFSNLTRSPPIYGT